MAFEPIAIVGRGCVLPQAQSPQQLWTGIEAGRVSLSEADPLRWRLPADGAECGELPIPGIGGFVRGFDDVFDPTGFRVPAQEIATWDDGLRWALHAGRCALADDIARGLPERSGLVIGNLGYPSAGQARYAEQQWLSTLPQRARVIPVLARADSALRFCSGSLAARAARALGLGGDAIALDAACASSLYAIKLACDRLHDRRADLMLAGGVSAADGLLIHLGFSGLALAALSPSGRSRPFHRGADGLVPAEGAALVTLMRLQDAIGQGRTVLGVIRGIGLANDGAAGGFLVPAQAGQERALYRAYHSARIDPATVTLLECHATGTPVGDAVELASAAAVFADCADLPLASAKGNLGHALTAAGAAAVLKVLGAMEHGVRPRNVGGDNPVPESNHGPLRLLQACEPWPEPRRAGISAFGFGGNNAHLILDGPDTVRHRRRSTRAFPAAEPIAVVAIGARVGTGESAADLRDDLMAGVGTPHRATMTVRMKDLRFPPNDMRVAPAQALILEAAREAAERIRLPRDTMVVIGVECDPEAARANAGVRHARWAAHYGVGDESAVEYDGEFSAARVIGTMANIYANRIGTHFDLTGPAFAVSADEASGPAALLEAARALRRREVDAAIVGAVDLSAEPVHAAALRDVEPNLVPGDAAVVLILRRLADARRSGDDVLAVLDSGSAPADFTVGPGTAFDPAEVCGNPYAARGLVAVTAAVLALRHRARFRVGAPADPALRAETAEVVVPRREGSPMRVRLRRGDRAPGLLGPSGMYVFSGADAAAVLNALEAGRPSDEGPARLAVVAGSVDEAARQAPLARRWLLQAGRRPAGMAFRPVAVPGDIAFVFTNGSAAAARMGRTLLLAAPSLVDDIAARFGDIEDAAGWAYRDPGTPRGSLDQIQGATVLAATHVAITRDILDIEPSAALGYSSGESTALVVLGAWTDPALMTRRFRSTELFSRDVGGELRAVRSAWAKLGITGSTWTTFLVGADAQRVRAAIGERAAVHLMIINTPDTCVLGGEADSCARVLADLGEVVAIPVPYDLAAHAPELNTVRDEWFRLHRLPTTAVPGVRFYSGATAEPYLPTPDRAAQAITDQVLGTVDFVALIERAYADGVRIFLEHGPGAQCTGWIKRILGDRDHLAVAMDARPDDGLTGLCHALAELAAGGVKMDIAALTAQLGSPMRQRPDDGGRITLAAHLAPVRAASGPAPETMLAAPKWEDPVTTALPDTGHRVLGPAADERRALSAVLAAQLRIAAAAHAHHVALFSESQIHYLEHQDRVLNLLAARSHGMAPPSDPDRARPGPKFTRAQLEYLATGRISRLFGPAFASQDADVRQTRMPAPPLLLADRVTGIDAEPATMGTGTIWTETDIRIDSWYLDHTGRIPASLLIEAGQADLLLISWLGADLANRGRRVYRLLGCEATFHASPPAAGALLDYEIRIVDHVDHGARRLFFFEYDCRADGRPLLSIRRGQAGFFTDDELTDTGGVLWDPATQAPTGTAEPVPLRCRRSSFDATAIAAFAQGRPVDCFGPEWDMTRTHIRTPRIAADRMLLIERVTDFDTTGGPWARGYLCAETTVTEHDWFFDGHFHRDPCMPGTLMLEGCLQAMSFYLAAAGFTVARDGWRFEPVPERPYTMRCRGQVTPTSRCLRYEVFVSGLTGEPHPALWADILVTVDGVKAFHVRGLGVRLVPDFPLTYWKQLGPALVQQTGDPVALPALGGLRGHHETTPVADIGGFPLGYASLLACAWGPEGDALGPAWRHVGDRRGGSQLPRLPGPPYHFMTRVREVTGPFAGLRVGTTAVVEYDVPDQVWYFAENPATVMPLSVLMEVVLQPCGWLSTYAGSTLRSDVTVFIRNLDGDVIVTSEVGPSARTISTRVELSSISEAGGLILETFRIDSDVDGVPVLHGTTTFGYFTGAALAEQVGMPPTPVDRERLVPGGRPIPARRRGLPGSMLLMLDEITGYLPGGGAAALGRVVATRQIDAGDWFFKAHFFQDPVMPGSLGVEAIVQAVQWLMLARGLDDGLTHPRFEAVAVDEQLRWKFRGQIVPTDAAITVEADILEMVDDAPRSRTVFAEAWLWIDGRRIYHVARVGMRITAGPPPTRQFERLDLEVDTWLRDHRPAYLVPTLPLMSIVDRIVGAAAPFTATPVTAITDLTLSRWVPVPSTAMLRTEVNTTDTSVTVALSVWRPAPRPELSRFEHVTTAGVTHPDIVRPECFPPLADSEPAPSPYRTGEMFHGTAFHYIVELSVGAMGATGVLDSSHGRVPPNHLPQGLLDAMTHVIPHTSLRRWSELIPPGQVGYPHRVRHFTSYEHIPHEGVFRVEARFAGFDSEDPVVDLQLIRDDRVLLSMQLVDRLFPLGGLADLDADQRRAFVRDRQPGAGAGFSTTRSDGVTILDTATILAWTSLPGTMERIYATPAHLRGEDLVTTVAMKEHVARQTGVHPSAVSCDTEQRTCHVRAHRYRLVVTATDTGFAVRNLS